LAISIDPATAPIEMSNKAKYIIKVIINIDIKSKEFHLSLHPTKVLKLKTRLKFVNLAVFRPYNWRNKNENYE
jgi:hypothetical protein